MIDETIYVQQLLDGKKIDSRGFYGACYLIAKYYLERGADLMDVIDNIRKWEEKYNYNINHKVASLNNLVHKAVDDKAKLTDDVKIYINEKDIKEISKRFDNKNLRFVSLGVLCYAKAFSKNNEFNLSLTAFSDWLGLRVQHISALYMPELEKYNYVHKVVLSEKDKSKKNLVLFKKQITARVSTYKIDVPIKNTGSYMLKDNNINKLYDDIFSS